MDAGSRNRGSIDTYVAPQDSYVPLKEDAFVAKDIFVDIPQDTSADVPQDTYVAPDVQKDTSCIKRTLQN